MTPTAQLPEQEMAPTLSEKDLIGQYSAQFEQLVNQNCRMAVDKEKIFQYAVVRRNDFYYRGNQNLVPTFAANGEIYDYRPVNGSNMNLTSGAAPSNKSPIYDYVINNFRGDMRKFVGVLGQKSPNVKAMPTWDKDDEGTKRANIASDAAYYLRSQWDVEGGNRYLVLSLGKNGTTFLYTPFVADAEKYGYREEPEWGTKPEKIEPDSLVCPNCQHPNPVEAMAMGCEQCLGPLSPADLVEGRTEDIKVITGYKKYPQGSVELHVHSVYDVTTPFYIKSLEECPWLWKELERDAAACVQRFPDRGLEEMLKNEQSTGVVDGGNSTTEMGRLARNQASSPSGYEVYERPNRWRESTFWIRPSMYMYLIRTGVDQGDKLMNALRQQYPRGMKLTFINSKLVQIEHERLDEVWAAVKPETSEYIYCDPIFNDYIQGADVMNDATNIIIQMMETNIAALIFDPNVLNASKIRSGFQVNEFIPCVPGMGSQLDKAFYKVPTSEADAALFQFVSTVHETLRENIGLLPAIWGGDEGTQTAEQARRRLNQALMILATTWNEMRKGWAAAFRNGVRQLARYSLGRLVNTQGDADSVTIKDLPDLGEILKGGWAFQCDQSIPLSWTQLRDFVMEILSSNNPAMIQQFAMEDPENAEKTQEAIGLPGWNLPVIQECKRIRGLIGRLLEGSPTMTPMGPMPSIPLDFKATWNPQLCAKVMHEWLMSTDGEAAEGSPGFDNVAAACMEAINFMAPPPVAPPGKPGGTPAPSTPGGDPLPGPLEGTQPPAAPEAPLQPLNGPGGGMQFNEQPMIQ